jgi:Replication-relaxation
MAHVAKASTTFYSSRMKRDALNRRSRFAGRQPSGKRIILGERDFAYFTALERHGPLPATYLYALTKDIARNHKGHQLRLTELYNEDNTPHRGFYLERPEQQYASINARYQPMAYELTEQGQKALRDKAIPVQMWQAPNGPYLHRFMTACITASIELACRELGFKYLSQQDILTHRKAPASLSDIDHPLALPCGDGVIVPDQLFGIDYGGKYRFFALEADRKTETIVSTRAMAKSFANKLTRYAYVLENQTYRDVWGIPTLSVLTVTVSDAHMRTMINQVETNISNDKTALRFLFKSKPRFGKYWTVPDIMADLVADPWERVASAFNISKP